MRENENEDDNAWMLGFAKSSSARREYIEHGQVLMRGFRFGL